MKCERHDEQRLKPLLELIPKVDSVLDIGSGNEFFKCICKDHTSLDMEDADIIQDLNKKQRIPLKSNSKDLVILSNIIEHITDPTVLISESKRISRKYILIGLPNEYPLHKRIRILLGLENGKGLNPYGHKHIFSVKAIDKFIGENYGNHFFRMYYFEFPGGRHFPKFLKGILCNLFPNLFVGEVFYLVI